MTQATRQCVVTRKLGEALSTGADPFVASQDDQFTQMTLSLVQAQFGRAFSPENIDSRGFASLGCI